MMYQVAENLLRSISTIWTYDRSEVQSKIPLASLLFQCGGCSSKEIEQRSSYDYDYESYDVPGYDGIHYS